MPLIPVMWALGLFSGGVVVGGLSFSNITNKMLVVGLVGVGIYAYTKTKA